ncbi:MAG: hypothetical protein ACYDAK_05850 [Candidatus Limnocylindrales bacterium]
MSRDRVDHLPSARRVHTFHGDVTIPIGHPCMGGGIAPARIVVDPLESIGFVLAGGTLTNPMVVVWVDRTLSLCDDDQPFLALSPHAVHPMSYCGTGEVSADFIGMARRARQHALPDVVQVYASSCRSRPTSSTSASLSACGPLPS